MKTKEYNPSELEVNFAIVLEKLKDQIEAGLKGNRIVHIDNHHHDDNPNIRFHTIDNDGDHHEIVVKIIQLPDA
ncbi:hypothetical protein [Fulvivirga sedimenti]|uniref:Uncharacterized protein n=1 Tax=Fulvivirga sedimenti TaxID=2879465 RepID=A0A9X1HKQ4_9BACT|nr:hypothetical protein [Fulvivirga sedimenti]MCA6073671.1 hypothetical protein [Fulvivirga sedimenti]